MKFLYEIFLVLSEKSCLFTWIRTWEKWERRSSAQNHPFRLCEMFSFGSSNCWIIEYKISKICFPFSIEIRNYFRNFKGFKFPFQSKKSVAVSILPEPTQWTQYSESSKQNFVDDFYLNAQHDSLFAKFGKKICWLGLELSLSWQTKLENDEKCWKRSVNETHLELKTLPSRLNY